jgi:hypothetical protein
MMAIIGIGLIYGILIQMRKPTANVSLTRELVEVRQ